jgi:hypothetical protein
MKYKLPLIMGITVVVLLSAFAIAQLTSDSISDEFNVNLNELPSQQSERQTLFGCPYDREVEHRITNVYEVSGQPNAPQVIVDVSFWTRDRTCAGSKTLNLTLIDSPDPQQMATNLNSAINAAFLEEANANNRLFVPRNPIAIGTSD